MRPIVAPPSTSGASPTRPLARPSSECTDVPTAGTEYSTATASIARVPPRHEYAWRIEPWRPGVLLALRARARAARACGPRGACASSTCGRQQACPR
eukprot:2579908-Pleurochrysis_carterae.AAC.1